MSSRETRGRSEFSALTMPRAKASTDQIRRWDEVVTFKLEICRSGKTLLVISANSQFKNCASGSGKWGAPCPFNQERI